MPRPFRLGGRGLGPQPLQPPLPSGRVLVAAPCACTHRLQVRHGVQSPCKCALHLHLLHMHLTASIARHAAPWTCTHRLQACQCQSCRHLASTSPLVHRHGPPLPRTEPPPQPPTTRARWRGSGGTWSCGWLQRAAHTR